MAEKVRPVRPDPRDNSVTDGTQKKLNPADLNAEIARLRAAERFMDKSGTLAISSKIQIAHVAVLMAIRDTGFDLNNVIDVYEEYEKRSPNLDGIGRSQSIQILTAPQVLIPGVGRMEGIYPEKPGIFSRFFSWLTGSGDDKNQQVKQ